MRRRELALVPRGGHPNRRSVAAGASLGSGIEATELRRAFCRATGRGELSWCGGGRVLDRDHLWSTIQAPRGTPQLAEYSPVTDIHGVDVYPITLTNPNGDLSQVGRWTNTIASVTPNHAVWTTLQAHDRTETRRGDREGIRKCGAVYSAAGSSDSSGSGRVLA
jgi:hypothetical protein